MTVPGSKSITNRALVAAALADGTSLLTGALLAEDTYLMIEALRALGIAITVDEADCAIEITGCRGLIPAGEARLFCGNAGTVMRFCTALTALGHGRFELDGVERMRKRPIGELGEVLQALGSGIEYLEAHGYPPIAVRASGLRGGQVSFHSPESTQFISALLLAAPYARGDVFIEVTGEVPSIPYLKLTTALMDKFEVAVIEQHDSTSAKYIVAAPQRYRGVGCAVEPDASNATYFLAAPAIAGGRVTVEGLGTDSVQGDWRFVDVLERMGCHIERSPKRLTVTGPSRGEGLRGIDVDLSDMPDTVQTLAVLALFADGPTTIRNVGNLRIKETDRLAALNRELTKLGAAVDERPDGLQITPPEQITPGTIDTYNDHRMAMSFALAGLKWPGMVINDPECCGKTFPDFFDRYEQLIAAGR
ncbi:MAG: 3-phosphoshikimate 1-carboxyvinyltransferase [Phycisphaerales bacterium]|nr:MAG: 3-phosphoshikimate 1-carboxyvinyltransferase [Phycisphaerales bacterium]